MSDYEYLTGSAHSMEELSKQLRTCLPVGIAAGGIIGLVGTPISGFFAGGAAMVGCLSFDSARKTLDEFVEKVEKIDSFR